MGLSPETTHVLTDWMRHPDPGRLPAGASLAEIAVAWPWFTTVRLLLARVRGGEVAATDPLLETVLSSRPVSRMWLAAPVAADFARRSEDEIIDTFLQKGEYKIVPKDDTPEADLATAAAIGEEDDPVSEELAEIYLAQGLASEARAIYSKLSLLYPEKSIYFAELIERMRPAEDENQL